MSRLGYVCDGCGKKNERHGPAASVQDDGLDWWELCSSCYDEWRDGNQQEVMA